MSEINNNFPGLASVVSTVCQIKSEFINHFDFKKDDFWVAYILHSLPTQHEQLRVALKTKDNLTLDSLKTFLNQEAMRGETATIAKMSSEASSKDFCLICGKKNHKTENCFRRMKGPVVASNNNKKDTTGQSNGNQKKNTKKNHSTKNEDKKSKPESAVSANLVVKKRCLLNVVSNKNTSPWYIDSGATHHQLNRHCAQFSKTSRYDVGSSRWF